MRSSMNAIMERLGLGLGLGLGLESSCISPAGYVDSWAISFDCNVYTLREATL